MLLSEAVTTEASTMAPLNSQLRTVGGSPAISRTSSEKEAELSPQLKQKAEEVADNLLSRLRPHVYQAALFALDRQRDESSAKIWLERRVFRPMQLLVEQATKVKKSPVVPPSRKPSKSADATGTWHKASRTDSAPPPPTKERDERDDAGRALRRALEKPDRASIPARPPSSSRRPVPPPPSVTQSAPAPGPELSTPHAPDGDAGEPDSSAQQSLLESLRHKLAALRYLDTPEEQAGLLVELLARIAPCSCILIHTVNQKNQEALAVGVHGERAAALLGFITEAEDQLLTQLRRTRRPVKILSPAHDDRCRKGRWAVFSPTKYLVALPIVHEHKLLGVFELADPSETSRLGPSQLEALDAVAKAWAARLGKGA